MLTKRDVIHLAFKGGYPEPMEMPERRRRRWFREYLNDLLTHDIRDVTEIRKVDVLEQVAQWLLAHSSQFFSIDELSAKVGLAKPTAESYLSALKLRRGRPYAMKIFDICVSSQIILPRSRLSELLCMRVAMCLASARVSGRFQWRHWRS